MRLDLFFSWKIFLLFIMDGCTTIVQYSSACWTCVCFREFWCHTGRTLDQDPTEHLQQLLVSTKTDLFQKVEDNKCLVILWATSTLPSCFVMLFLPTALLRLLLVSYIMNGSLFKANSAITPDAMTGWPRACSVVSASSCKEFGVYGKRLPVCLQWPKCCK